MSNKKTTTTTAKPTGDQETPKTIEQQLAECRAELKVQRDNLSRVASSVTTTLGASVHPNNKDASFAAFAKYNPGCEIRRTIVEYGDLTEGAPGVDFQEAVSDKAHPEERLKAVTEATSLDSVTTLTYRGSDAKTAIISTENSNERQGVSYFMLAEQVRRNTLLLQNLFTTILPSVCDAGQMETIRATCADHLKLAEVPHLREDPSKMGKKRKAEAEKELAEADKPANKGKHRQYVTSRNMEATAVPRFVETGHIDERLQQRLDEDDAIFGVAEAIRERRCDRIVPATRVSTVNTEQPATGSVFGMEFDCLGEVGYDEEGALDELVNWDTTPASTEKKRAACPAVSEAFESKRARPASAIQTGVEADSAKLWEELQPIDDSHSSILAPFPPLGECNFFNGSISVWRDDEGVHLA